MNTQKEHSTVISTNGKLLTEVRMERYCECSAVVHTRARALERNAAAPRISRQRIVERPHERGVCEWSSATNDR